MSAFAEYPPGDLLFWLLAAIAMLLPARLRHARPTGLAFIIVLAPVPLLALSMLFPPLEGFCALYTLLLPLAILLDAFVLSPSPSLIGLRREIAARLSIGQAQPVRLHLSNPTAHRLQCLIRDDAPPELLPPGQSSPPTLSVTLSPFAEETLSYELLPTKRGPFRFERIHLRYRSRLGLLWLSAQGGEPETIAVIPDLRRVRRIRVFASRTQSAGESKKRVLGPEGTRFSGLRHYFTGDDVRKMAWQAAAKLDMPIVRTFAPEVEQPVLVLIDAGRKMSVPAQSSSTGPTLLKYDCALNIALSFAAVALDKGDYVGAGIFSNRVLARVAPGRGRAHMRRLLRVLGESQSDWTDPDYETVLLQCLRGLKRRTLVVLLTDPADPAACQSLMRGLRRFSRHHLMLLVTLSDGELSRFAEEPAEAPYNIYRKGLAMDMLDIRSQTLQALSHTQNIIPVDAPPDQLDEALVRRYFQIKARGQF